MQWARVSLPSKLFFTLTHNGTSSKQEELGEGGFWSSWLILGLYHVDYQSKLLPQSMRRIKLSDTALHFILLSRDHTHLC